MRQAARLWFRSLWPLCSACKQSMTSVYAGKATCLRCCSRRSLTANAR